MNITGILLGLLVALLIGGGFLWVIKLEYYVGAHVAKPVAALGALVILSSLLMPTFASSAIVGVLGGSIVWGSTELRDQQDRVARGMFPANPNKSNRRVARIKTEGEGR